jgi:hypothetical protein
MTLRSTCPLSTFCGILVSLLIGVGVLGLARARAEGPPSGAPLRLGVLISSDSDRCYDAGVFKAIRRFASEEVADINRNGGIGGRPVELKLFDDGEDVEKTTAFVNEAISDPAMVGFVGIGSSTRGNVVFGRIGEAIGKSRLPLVTDISLSQIYAPYPNVFSMASAVADELDVVRALLKDRGFVRPAFVGIDGDLYSASLGDGLAASDSAPKLALDRRVAVKDYQIDPAAVAPLVENIVAAQADIVILAIHSGPGAEVLRRLVAQGHKLPILVLYGRIGTILRFSDGLPAGLQFFELGRDGVPTVYNERLRQLIWRSRSADWVFEDTRNPANKDGWASGRCKPKKDQSRRHVFDAGNQRAVGRGMQYRDMLHLMATVARTAPAGATVAELRDHISRELGGYVEGSKVFQGLWQDWTFTRNRAVASDILITTSGTDPKSRALAPVQYRRVNASLVRSPVVDMSIDLIRIANIDSNERRFDAEFYLSLKSVDNDVSILAVDFTNAARSQFGRDLLISSRVIHDGATGSKFPAGVKVYKVSGTFQFNPELGAYPFDTQRLSVSFQARNASNPFLIQPLAQHLRQSGGEVDGWALRDQYVGSEQDIISTIAADGIGRHVVPIYKFNQTWTVRRISIDYYIRVVVPLAFILLVTYFSVYLPPARFDSTVAIQVTALLSSIALYLALPKVDSDQATLSDKMFIMTYAAVALMIGLTILKDSRWLTSFRPGRVMVVGIQRVAFPVTTVLIVAVLMSAADRKSGNVLQALGDLWRALAG